MRKKCGRGDRASASAVLVGPYLWDAEEAAEAVRLSYGWGGRESIVVLVCDEERQVLGAFEFEGAVPSDATAVVELLARTLPDAPSLVIGICRPDGPRFLDRFETEAVQETADRCEEAGLGLLYVIVANEDGWRRLPEFGDPERD